MSTGYGWEGIRQVCATLLGARHVPEHLCGGFVYLGGYKKESIILESVIVRPISVLVQNYCSSTE